MYSYLIFVMNRGICQHQIHYAPEKKNKWIKNVKLRNLPTFYHILKQQFKMYPSFTFDFYSDS